MRKIIVSIMILSFLLSATSLSIGLESNVNNNNLNIVDNDITLEKKLSEPPRDVNIFTKDTAEKQPQGMQANTIVTGHVLDIRTGSGIANADVGFIIEHTDGWTCWFDELHTTESGEYVFDIQWGGPPELGYGFVSKTGYNDISYYYFSLNAGETNYVDFHLDTKPKAAANGNYNWGSVDEVNEAISFEGTGSDVNGNIVLYEWDFNGDGIYDYSSTDTGITRHSYSIAGNYAVTLRVTDDEGFSATDEMDVYVLEHRPNTHSKITILGDNWFKLPESISGVVSGSGTKDDPYIIENWEIQCDGDDDSGIKIHNTEDYVVIRNVNIKNAKDGFDLYKVKNVKIENCNIIDFSNVGVQSLVSSFIFQNNLLVTASSNSGIFAANLIFFPFAKQEMTINQNIISGCTFGIYSVPCSYDFIIKNNIIKHCNIGIYIQKNALYDNSHIFIYHNVIDAGKVTDLDYGLMFILNYNEIGDIFVEYNIIKSWDLGLYKDGGNVSTGNFCVNNNNIIYSRCQITGAWESAVFNWVNPIDVRFNWWGSSEGPGHDGLDGPRNWPRTDYGGVDYMPYLTAPVENAGPTTNPPPDAPQINGPASGGAGEEYTYTATTSDPNGEDIYYLFDWGDETTSGWLGPYESGDTASVIHTWAKTGDYKVRVIAKDSSGCISTFSDSLPITMPYSQQSTPTQQTQPSSQPSSQSSNLPSSTTQQSALSPTAISTSTSTTTTTIVTSTATTSKSTSIPTSK